MKLEGFIKHYRKELKNAMARKQRAHADTAAYMFAAEAVRFYKAELDRTVAQRAEQTGTPTTSGTQQKEKS